MSAQSNDWQGYMKRRHHEDIRAMRVAFLKHLMTQPDQTGSVDAIRALVPVTANPVMLGLVTRGGIYGLLVSVGWKNSINGISHNRPIRLWKLKSIKEAEQWISDNPPKEVSYAGVESGQGAQPADRPDNGNSGCLSQRQGEAGASVALVH